MDQQNGVGRIADMGYARPAGWGQPVHPYLRPVPQPVPNYPPVAAREQTRRVVAGYAVLVVEMLERYGCERLARIWTIPASVQLGISFGQAWQNFVVWYNNAVSLGAYSGPQLLNPWAVDQAAYTSEIQRALTQVLGRAPRCFLPRPGLHGAPGVGSPSVTDPSGARIAGWGYPAEYYSHPWPTDSGVGAPAVTDPSRARVANYWPSRWNVPPAAAYGMPYGAPYGAPYWDDDRNIGRDAALAGLGAEPTEEEKTKTRNLWIGAGAVGAAGLAWYFLKK